jgi:exopolysaccharide biosynthesis protein
VCTTKKPNVVKFIVVDGRYPGADGMTIPELANYLYRIGCKSAINLDGGGSSALYIKDLGIVNNSVKRSISNAITIS